MIEIALSLILVGLVGYFVIPEDAAVWLGGLAIPTWVVIVVISAVVFGLGYIYGLRRGRKTTRLFS